jgi:hypothetical protein
MFARIHTIMKDVGVISVERLEELKKLGPAFVMLYRETFDGQHVALKFHLLETHLLWWAELYTAIGLFAEDAGESAHAMIVRIEHRFGSQKGQRLDRLIMNAVSEKQNTALRVAQAGVEERKRRPIGPRSKAHKKATVEKLPRLPVGAAAKPKTKAASV